MNYGELRGRRKILPIYSHSSVSSASSAVK